MNSQASTVVIARWHVPAESLVERILPMLTARRVEVIRSGEPG